MKYPIGIQTFEDIRNENFVYVDKTKLVYDLVTKGRYYFLSRPRRFGKSLLISTLESYFEGRKDLFKGLALGELERDWVKYPVIKIDFNNIRYGDKNSLSEVLNAKLAFYEKFYNVDIIDKNESNRFINIIHAAYEQTCKKVAILVDEYDKPLLANIETGQNLDDVRNQLKAFYSVLKSEDKYIRFGILTGVTRFSKVSVFSDLNNLNDISMDPKYATICGISESELHATFDTQVGELAAENNLTKDECYAKLKKMYDGYRFSQKEEPGIYNPFSILSTLSKKIFSFYWFQTGTPTFLTRALQKVDVDLQEKFAEPVSSSDLASIDSFDKNPISVIFQSGYLTIKSYDSRFNNYTLGFPNEEVKQGFLKDLSPYFIKKEKFKQSMLESLVLDVENGKANNFMKRIQQIFADKPYVLETRKTCERDFQNAFYLIFNLLGFYVNVETISAKGRIDILLQTNKYIYIIELKVGKSADEALAQIEKKKYANKFANDKRKLFKIGANFSRAARTMTEFKIVKGKVIK